MQGGSIVDVQGGPRRNLRPSGADRPHVLHVPREQVGIDRGEGIPAHGRLRHGVGSGAQVGREDGRGSDRKGRGDRACGKPCPPRPPRSTGSTDPDRLCGIHPDARTPRREIRRDPPGKGRAAQLAGRGADRQDPESRESRRNGSKAVGDRGRRQEVHRIALLHFRDGGGENGARGYPSRCPCHHRYPSDRCDGERSAIRPDPRERRPAVGGPLQYLLGQQGGRPRDPRQSPGFFRHVEDRDAFAGAQARGDERAGEQHRGGQPREPEGEHREPEGRLRAPRQHAGLRRKGDGQDRSRRRDPREACQRQHGRSTPSPGPSTESAGTSGSTMRCT